MRLKEEKRRAFTTAFLREFARQPFDDASISSVVKEAGFAKGSVYQYFEDKKDLFLYLVSHSSSVKAGYIAHLKREDYNDFWDYFRDLYACGVQFDLENPVESHFLHRLQDNLNSPSIKELFKSFRNQAVAAFEAMVRYEVDKGLFRNDLPVNIMAFFLYKTGIAIMEHMEAFSLINPVESIERNQPVYQDRVNELMETVDHYIILLKSALER